MPSHNLLAFVGMSADNNRLVQASDVQGLKHSLLAREKLGCSLSQQSLTIGHPQASYVKL